MAQRTLSLNSLKTPVRPAPPPPASVARLQNASINSSEPPKPQPRKKNPAPPRPPPPKVSSQLKAIQNAVAFTGMLHKPPTLGISVTAPDLLINWDSPPTSPTPGRSSSDGLSLRSFGSDSSGTTANGGTMTRSESSGFESEPDAWSETLPTKNEHKPFSMPTIIRPKSKAPSTGSTHLEALEKAIGGSSNSLRSSSPYAADLLDLDCSQPADYSPPEPTIPPPAPPSFTLSAPSEASAVALFDYQTSHPGDLNFKEGDRIVLTSKVNEEWLRGCVGSAEGMFPVSFVRIVVPLEEEPAPSNNYNAFVLYAFEGETSEDLSLQEGDEVQVIESIGNGWLYGQECRSGRRGQFPESFVRRGN